MKVLMVHNDYGVYSGEEAVVDRMVADGQRYGHQIETLRLSSKGSRDHLTGKIRAFFSGIWSIRGRRLMRQALNTFRPDLVHIHNLYPFISPAVLPICHRKGIPVVMTVHNYRLICPTGLFLRDGKPCENCLKNGNERNCIRYNCEENRFRSIAYALRNSVARHTKAYLNNVDYFCCLTDFQKEKLIAAGYPAKKIKVFPNVVEEVAKENANTSEQTYVGYVGRHNYAKGDDLLMEVAKRHPEIPFHFAGISPEEITAPVTDNVTLCGMLNHEQLNHFYKQARFIVIPSRCYEGFPMALVESFAHGRCCIVPNHGPFPDLIHDKESNQDCGKTFQPIDTDDLDRQIVWLWNHPDLSNQMGDQAQQMTQRRFQREKINQEWDHFLHQMVAEHQAK